MMRCCLLVFTDGRKSCLKRTLEYADHALIEENPGAIEWRIIVNDSMDPDYAAWLQESYGDRYAIRTNPEKRGFCGSIQAGWSLVPDEATHVFHLEDDFIFSRPAPLRRMALVLEENPHLVQLVFKRQAWSPEEQAVGGIVEKYPAGYTEVLESYATWTEHELFFSTNPTLYRASLISDHPWPDPPECEGHYTFQLRDRWPGCRFAFWGGKFDPPWVIHIGDERAGDDY